MTASSSKIDRWRRCRRKGYYTDVLKLQRIRQSIKPFKGGVVHEALAVHYAGGDWTEPVKSLKIDYDNLFDEEREEWGNLPKEVYRIVRGYLIAYGAIDKGIKVLAVEQYFKYTIGKHEYEGYIDLIYEDKDGVWVTDHKTVSALPKETELYMDSQTFMYFDACSYDENLVALLKGKKLAGVVFNHIKTKPPKEPKLLASGGLSKAEIDTDIQTYFATVKAHGLDPEDYADMIPKLQGKTFFRRLKIPVSTKVVEIIKSEIATTMNEIELYMKKAEMHGVEETSHLFPRTLLKQRCTWDCEFNKLCFAELSGQNTSVLLETEYEPRTTRATELVEDTE